MKPMPYDKATLRSRFLNGRRRMAQYRRAADSAAIRDHVLRLPEAAASTVAAYIAAPEEPATAELIAALRTRGSRVIAPVLGDDDDLDWALYEGPAALARGRYGVSHPTGPRLGRDAVAAAGLVIVPALAVAPGGVRLGRGGGSYDRALARVPAATAVVALLYDEEVVAWLPSEPHDRPVTAAVTPSGLVRW